MLSTVIYQAEFGIIACLVVVLFSKRRFISRWGFAGLAVVVARLVGRSITNAQAGTTASPVYEFLGTGYMMHSINILAILILSGELIAGTKCWRVARINKRRRLRKLVALQASDIIIVKGDK